MTKPTLLLGLLAILPLACNKPMEQKAAPEAPVAAADRLEILPDVAQRAAQLPKTVIDYDRVLLGEDERNVVAKLIEASQFIDEIYWLQVAEDNLTLRDRLAAQAAASRKTSRLWRRSARPARSRKARPSIRPT